uniref:Replicative DNA helicase n=1 Tax=Porphyridium purpureum TaxID=35688 RepID=W0RZE1_PORPP|nr:replication helicase subunit [Porphyridium purpureum]BAO23802.1 replication helicase subunit [Porphyridium purpureum]
MITKYENKFLYNTLIEKTIIGAIIFGNVNLDKVFTQLKPEFFFLESHKVIFEILHGLYKTNQYFEIIDINNALLTYSDIYKDYRFDFEEIRNLSNQTFTTLYLDDYIILLVEKYIRRSILNLAYNLIESAQDDSIDMQQLLENTSTKLTKIIQPSGERNRLKSLDKIFLDISKHLLEHGNLSGLKSGFKDMDSITRGFQKSDLIILAARPSIGKTAFALNVASNVAKSSGEKVLYFSLEMSKEQLFLRLISSATNTSRLRLEDLRISKEQLLKIQEHTKNISSILIDDSALINHDYIANQLQEYQNKKDNIALIIIDYLQLMQDVHPSSKQEIKRAQELSNITRSLKNTARSFNVPIILLSQVGRGVESRVDKRPLLSDLKDSGCVGSNNYCTSDSNLSKLKINKLFFYRYSKILSSLFVNFIKNDHSFIRQTNFFSYGSKPLYQYEFYSHRYLELSANHMIFNTNDWIRTDFIVEINLLFMNKIIVDQNIDLCYGWALNLYHISFLTSKEYNTLDFIGFYKTYDISIELTKNFLVNNVVLHNSIEQDADLVLMLYRESYYNQAVLDIDETELIITKHRNGPLGTIKLSFNPVYMSFSDYK